jgi:multiple sugar transport system substrate-binding protein
MPDNKMTPLTVAGRWLGVLALILILCVVLISRQRMLAAAQPHNPARIPVYYWHMWSGEWQPTMEQVVAEFNASQTKYEVIPLSIPYASADSKFLMSVAGGHPPDVMTQWTQAISTWSQDGVLQPLDTRMTPAERRFFLQGTYPVIHQNG